MVASAIVGGAVIGGVASVAGAGAQADAAESAANRSFEATKLSVEEQKRQFDLTREDFAPYREIGGTALSELAALYGISREGLLPETNAQREDLIANAPEIPQEDAGTSLSPKYNFNEYAWLDDLANRHSMGDAEAVGLLGWLEQQGAIKRYSDENDEDYWDWNRNASARGFINDLALGKRDPATGLAPEAGTEAGNFVTDAPPEIVNKGLPGAAGKLITADRMATDEYKADAELAGKGLLPGSRSIEDARNRFKVTPGYDFRMQEGIRALDRSAAARGSLRGGGHQRELMRYGQGLASAEFENYANRLASLAGVGQSATGSTAAAGQASANAITAAYQTGAAQQGNALMAAGTARASGYAGVANAVNGAVGNYLFMNALKG